MIIAHACLEILDLRTSTHKYSETELDFTRDLTSEYVTKIIEKVNKNPNKRVGSFNDESLLKKCLLEYDPNNFIESSKKIADVFLNILNKNGIKTCQDLLICEYRVEDLTYLGLILLENIEAITHENIMINNLESNQFTKNVYILPESVMKINTFMIISLPDLNFYSCEKLKEIEGSKRKVIEESIDAKYHPSTNEIMKSIKDEAKRISEETGIDYLETMSNVNSFIFQKTSDNNINIKDLADAAFTDESIKKEFKANLSLKGVSEAEPIEYDLVSEKVKNQKIKTDTGIELIIPQEFFKDNSNVEIKNNPDGTMSIEIKNFTKLISR